MPFGQKEGKKGISIDFNALRAKVKSKIIKLLRLLLI
jgi:hypothetical protein